MDKVKKYYFVAHDWVLDHKKVSGAIVLVLIGVVVGKFL